MLVFAEAAITQAHRMGELRARPPTRSIGVRGTPGGAATKIGEQVLAHVRVVVPSSYRVERPAGVLVMLHGAGGEPAQAVSLVRAFCSRENLIIVAPKSQAATWDLLRGGFGPDVAQIDRALAAVFARYAVDPARLAIGGFSDGASYALTLGLANGELFRTILAFSPGFEAAPRSEGTPRIFISHGVDDRVLGIDRTSRRIVPALRKRGYDVDYHELDCGHAVPALALREAFAHLRGRGMP